MTEELSILRKRFNRWQAQVNELVIVLERELERMRSNPKVTPDFIQQKDDQIDTIVQFNNVADEFITKLGGGIKVQPAISEVMGKMPPHANELEEAILGALMLEADALKVLPILRYWHFYKEANQLIYKAIVAVKEKAKPDMATIVFELRKTGHIDIVGGPYYIAELTSKVASAANIEYHCRCLIEMSIKREMSRLASLIHTQAYDDTIDAFQLVETTERTLNHLKTENIQPLG